ncbi:MAG: 2-polyprenyl-6-methoxyphenol hydroxylase-like oxidoreductase [Nostoc sp. ChiSLP02]|nr:2-polyprenyl-6-methoxyphenol hydroxylase-like oxidoreductase [Nostoc sp. DedSLP05]MDZ8102314.1 2-polyprenyl-6-methoxyphenol hydroxylase-like oxidoreductase [Nostoc sp. DedSLP01]MDZ8188389.1 2-polyprenyl-6-methoxyphenol hydroxylase-like oxidoreductase [Nostoc sp. ChiSLP02]
MKTIAQQAIVIGASMGGLLAARALADYYQQVTVLERDIFPDPGKNRKGVPQDRHAHALLSRGREVLEQFFPGITQELKAQGALSTDSLQQTRWFANGGYFQKSQSDLNGLLVSRPLLEAQVRKRLLSLPNIKVIENCHVLGLLTTPDRTRIAGVSPIHHRDGSFESALNADLVVDATGRRSQSPVWLEKLGYEQPQEEQVRVDIGYMTRIYRRRPEHLQGDLATVVSPCLPNWRYGVMLGQEGDLWIVTLGAYLGDRVPSDEKGFLEFAKSLPAQEIYEVIKDAEPLCELLPYKFPTSQRRYYEGMARFPENYLVFGDAICSFNPIYGQGMTVAALESLALQNCLAQGSQNLRARFFKEAGKVVDIAWSIAVNNDLRIPQIQATRSPMVRFLNWYMSKLHVAARRDRVVAIAFLQVTNFMASPKSLMHPKISLRVLLGNLLQLDIARAVKYSLPLKVSQKSVQSW